MDRKEAMSNDFVRSLSGRSQLQNHPFGKPVIVADTFPLFPFCPHGDFLSPQQLTIRLIA
jgi:hypothetical protein